MGPKRSFVNEILARFAYAQNCLLDEQPIEIILHFFYDLCIKHVPEPNCSVTSAVELNYFWVFLGSAYPEIRGDDSRASFPPFNLVILDYMLDSDFTNHD